MATVTPNFNWPVPTSTDLVKDGATAIEALGDSIDASLVDLKGGTTGQVLSKTSGTDMDFTWVTTDDANAIQNSIVDAKGDLIAASAADTPARLAVGSNNALLVADSTTATGLNWGSLATSYTPTWTATTTNPVLGNGALAGYYIRTGDVVWFRIVLVAGSTTTFGSGTYRFSLPVAMNSATAGINGYSFVLDAGVAYYYNFNPVTVPAGLTTSCEVVSTAGAFVTPTSPITFGNADAIYIWGNYRA
jgi:hypothetical protein